MLNRGSGNEITVNANNVTIAGNFLGTNPAGTAALPGASGGLAIRQQSGNNNVFGGAAVADSNLLSGDLQGGIIVESGDGATIQGNYIGTDATGTAALNGHAGAGRNPRSGRHEHGDFRKPDLGNTSWAASTRIRSESAEA